MIRTKGHAGRWGGYPCKGSYLGQPISFRIVPCPDIINRKMANNEDDDDYMSGLIEDDCKKRKKFNMSLVMLSLMVLDLT